MKRVEGVHDKSFQNCVLAMATTNICVVEPSCCSLYIDVLLWLLQELVHYEYGQIWCLWMNSLAQEMFFCFLWSLFNMHLVISVDGLV